MTDTSYIQLPPANTYVGPDVYNPALEPPAGEVNYLAIMENDDMPFNQSRRQLLPSSDAINESSQLDLSNRNFETASADHHRCLQGNSNLTVGRGWALHIYKDDVPCNGTYDAECGRVPRNSCLLYGHNDGKGGLVFDSLSGWLLMRVKRVKYGLIIIKLETWNHANTQGKWSPVESSELTEGWVEENNGTVQRRLVDTVEQSKETLYVAPNPCPDFRFDFAINGQIQTLGKAKFFRMRKFVQSTVETWPLLDDPNFSFGKEVDVELGIRMRGCKRINSFKLTHVYWA
jgi:hypothetical protein